MNQNTKGTYVSVKVKNNLELYEWFKNQNIDVLDKEDLHCTLAYSKKEFKHVLNDSDILVNSSSIHNKLEPLGDEGAIVMKFDSEEMNKRFNQCIKEGALYDYPQYIPHISISYNGKDIDLDKIKVPDFDIILCDETTEELDLDWKDKLSSNEAKQVGIIYHFTTIKAIKSLLNKDEMDKFGCDVLTFASRNGHLSTTRDYQLTRNPLNDFKEDTHNIRIAIDGDKLSNKYKIKPISGLQFSNKEVFGTDKNHIRMPHKSESEEIVCPLKSDKYFKLKDYILEIQVLQHSYPESEDVFNSIKDSVKQLGLNIKVNSVRKWTSFNESYIFDNSEPNIIGYEINTLKEDNMPNSIIKSFSDKSGKSEAEVEKLWDELKQEYGDDYKRITGTLEKILKINEGSEMDLLETLDIKTLEALVEHYKAIEVEDITEEMIQKFVQDYKLEEASDDKKIVAVGGKAGERGTIIVKTKDGKTYEVSAKETGGDMPKVGKLLTDYIVIKEVTEQPEQTEQTEQTEPTTKELEEESDKRLQEDESYQEFFAKKLKEYNVKSPSELSEDDKTKFFNEISKEWKSKDVNESVDSILKTIKSKETVLDTKEVIGDLKGKKVKYLHVYVKDRKTNNPYNLETFSDSEGSGYLIPMNESVNESLDSSFLKLSQNDNAGFIQDIKKLALEALNSNEEFSAIQSVMRLYSESEKSVKVQLSKDSSEKDKQLKQINDAISKSGVEAIDKVSNSLLTLIVDGSDYTHLLQTLRDIKNKVNDWSVIE